MTTKTISQVLNCTTTEAETAFLALRKSDQTSVKWACVCINDTKSASKVKEGAALRIKHIMGE